MRDDTQVDFSSLGFAGSAAQRGGELTLEAREGALDLRPLTIVDSRKPPIHLAAILGLGPTSPTSFVQVNHRASDAQRFAGVDMIGFGIVSRVSPAADRCSGDYTLHAPPEPAAENLATDRRSPACE